MSIEEQALRQQVCEQMDVTLNALTVLGQAIYHRVDIDIEMMDVIPKSYGLEPADFMRALFREEVPHPDAVPYVIDHILTAGEAVVWVREEGGAPRPVMLMGCIIGLEQPVMLELSPIEHATALYAVMMYVGHNFLCIGMWDRPEAFRIRSVDVAIPTPRVMSDITEADSVIRRIDQLRIENAALRAEVERLRLEVQDAFDRCYYLKSCAMAEVRERTKMLDRWQMDLIEAEPDPTE